jgi:hypothetical protein
MLSFIQLLFIWYACMEDDEEDDYEMVNDDALSK